MTEQENSSAEILDLETRQDLPLDLPSVPVPLHLQDSRGSVLLSSVEVEDEPANGFPTVTRTSTEVPGCPRIAIPVRFRFRCCAAFFALFAAGWGDGLTGTILPHIKSDFNISYMMSSLLFVTSTFGFALGVIMIEQVMCLLGNIHLSWIKFPKSPKARDNQETRKKTRAPSPVSPKAGRGDKQRSPARARFRIVVIASLLHASFFILMGTATGLSNVLIAYFLGSLGKSLLNSTVNAYVSTGPNRPLGQMYACNAIGAFAAPLICQTLLARDIPWSHFYLGSLALSVINTTLLALAFRPTRNDGLEECPDITTDTQVEGHSRINCPTAVFAEGESPSHGHTAMSEKIQVSPSSTVPPNGSCLKTVLKSRYVWAISIFMLVYSGSETATQGYMATFLLVVRDGNPKTVGYVTSGFWGGMAVSRFICGLTSPYLSFTWRKHSIHFILAGALAMHLCIWFIDSVFANALSASIIGLLCGPVYPSVLALATDMLPKEMHMVGMAIIAGFANFGSSIFPFVVGALSNLSGPKVLVYTTVSQTAILIILWAFFPSKVPQH